MKPIIRKIIIGISILSIIGIGIGIYFALRTGKGPGGCGGGEVYCKKTGKCLPPDYCSRSGEGYIFTDDNCACTKKCASSDTYGALIPLPESTQMDDNGLPESTIQCVYECKDDKSKHCSSEQVCGVTTYNKPGATGAIGCQDKSTYNQLSFDTSTKKGYICDKGLSSKGNTCNLNPLCGDSSKCIKGKCADGGSSAGDTCSSDNDCIKNFICSSDNDCNNLYPSSSKGNCVTPSLFTEKGMNIGVCDGGSQSPSDTMCIKTNLLDKVSQYQGIPKLCSNYNSSTNVGVLIDNQCPTSINTATNCTTYGLCPNNKKRAAIENNYNCSPSPSNICCDKQHQIKGTNKCCIDGVSASGSCYNTTPYPYSKSILNPSPSPSPTPGLPWIQCSTDKECTTYNKELFDNLNKKYSSDPKNMNFATMFCDKDPTRGGAKGGVCKAHCGYIENSSPSPSTILEVGGDQLTNPPKLDGLSFCFPQNTCILDDVKTPAQPMPNNIPVCTKVGDTTRTQYWAPAVVGDSGYEQKWVQELTGCLPGEKTSTICANEAAITGDTQAYLTTDKKCQFIKACDNRTVYPTDMKKGINWSNLNDGKSVTRALTAPSPHWDTPIIQNGPSIKGNKTCTGTPISDYPDSLQDSVYEYSSARGGHCPIGSGKKFTNGGLLKNFKYCKSVDPGDSVTDPSCCPT